MFVIPAGGKPKAGKKLCLGIALFSFVMLLDPSGYGTIPHVREGGGEALKQLSIRRNDLVIKYGFYEHIPPNTTYDFYYITGNTYGELCRDIFDKERGKGSWNNEKRVRYAAQANYCYSWDGDSFFVNGKCRWKNISVDVDNTLFFPFWDIPVNADEEVVNKWERFVIPLKEHEYGHIRIYNEMAGVFRQAMSSLEAEHSGDLRKKTNEAFRVFLREVDARGAEYDRETEHGRTQGAVF